MFYLLKGDLFVIEIRPFSFNYEIDPYSFSPGSHTLTINFNLTTGEQGEVLQFEFDGLVRESK